MTYEATLRMEGYLVFEYEADADVAGAGEGWEDALQAKIAAMGRGELLSLLEAECVWVHQEAEDGMTNEVFAR